MQNAVKQHLTVGQVKHYTVIPPKNTKQCDKAAGAARLKAAQAIKLANKVKDKIVAKAKAEKLKKGK